MDNTKSEYTQEDISLLQKSKPSIQTVEGASLFEKQDKEKIKEALYQIAVPLVEIDFSRNNFNRLFPRSRIETPVKTNVFGERESSHLYVRSYIINEKRKAVQTVVVGIEDFNVAISTHPRDINNIINKIKTPDQLLFVATSVGRIIRQHTQEGQSVADSNRALSFGTLTEPPNKLYNEKKALSIKDLIELQKIVPVQGTTNNARQAGKGVYMSKESSTSTVETPSFFEKQDRNTENPELKTYHTLKEEDIYGLEIISDEEFSDIVDSIILNDYKHIPNSIRLPNLNEQLTEKLGLTKDTAFILKKNATHIRPDRKGGYGQAFDTEEYKLIPEILRTTTFAVIDKAFKNFQIVFDDVNDETKINKIVFNKDKLGNYLVTLGKVDRENAFSLERNSVVAVGVAPTIQTLKTRASSTALRASTTTVNKNIIHNTTSVNTSLVQGTTNNAHQAGKGVYMSNEFAALEAQYLEQMANGGASDRALEEGYLEQESQKDTRNLYSQGDVVKEGQKKPYYQQQAENLLDAVKSGKVPFLPQEPILGEDGKMVYSGNYTQDGDKLVITPRPAVRMLSGNILTGVNQLTAQIELDKMGRKSQTVLTWEQAKQEECFIKKGSQSFVLTGYDKDAGEGQSKSRVYYVFAAGDVSNNKSIQGALSKNANANAPKPWTKETLSCHDSTPEKFLGTYMAACSTGAKFETDRATVQQFQQQFTQMMEKSIEEKQHTAIFEVGRNAQKYASSIRYNGYKQWEKAHNQEKETHTRNLQQRAKGMEMGL